MTDSEIIETLAKLEGWREVSICDGDGSFFPVVFGFSPAEPSRYLAAPRYLESRDALAPVLEKLTQAQWTRLVDAMVDQSRARIHSLTGMRERLLARFLLTCPPRTLAEAVAAVVKEGR